MRDMSFSNTPQNTPNQSEDLDFIHTFLNEKFKDSGILLETHPVSTCEKVKEFRGNLIANVSHDLRTPLQSIIGYSETMLMQQHSVSPKQQTQYLNVILNSAKRLSFLIEQFFEYSKLEVSEVTPQMKPFSVEYITEEIQQNYKLINQNRKITLNIDQESDLPCIFGDYLMIYRVFQNLIDNALKFTPDQGTITIGISKFSENRLQVQISDTGTGIPNDKLDSIFNKFQKTKDIGSGTGENDGIGLGLAIVRKILSLHNAEIFVQSELGQGTTFTFFLPVER